jgi:hypothetical protein
VIALRLRVLASCLLLSGALILPAQAAPAHDLQISAHSGLSVYLSSARTMGGGGGGVGLRDTIDDRIILQGDTTYLMGLGNVLALRLSAGVQRRGAYVPAALLTAGALLGSQLSFLTSDHRPPGRAPAMTAGLVLAPLRFRSGGTQLSLLEIGFGFGGDYVVFGRAYEVRLLEVAISLGP